MDLLTKKELLNKCEELNIKAYKSKNKKELIKLINDSVSVTTVPPEQCLDKFELIQGDCLIEMPKIADKSIDMILCCLLYTSPSPRD